MKIKVAPGRVLKLTPRTNTSIKGGEYDLDAYGVAPEDRKRILALEGVTEMKGAPSTAATAQAKKEGDA